MRNLSVRKRFHRGREGYKVVGTLEDRSWPVSVFVDGSHGCADCKRYAYVVKENVYRQEGDTFAGARCAIHGGEQR